MRTRGSLGMALALMVAPLPLLAQAQQTGVGSQFELSFWQSVADSQDRAQYEAYLSQYPNGTFSALARAKIAAIARQEAMAHGGGAGAAPSPPPVPAPAVVPAAPAAAVAVPPSAPPSPPPLPSAAAPAADAGPVALPSLADQLNALGQSQGTRKSDAGPQAVLPAPPTLREVPKVDLPAHFCSAAERNAFHQTVYVPAKAAADQNNDTTIAYLGQLQGIYDGYANAGKHVAMNEVAAASKAYSETAVAAHDVSVRYKDIYSQLMAVPIIKC